MRIAGCALLLGWFGFFAGERLAAQSSSAGPQMGPWQVGFVFIHSVDSTRPMENGNPRPLDLGIWYPTETAGPPRLTYRAYFLVASPEAEVEKFIQFLLSHGAAERDVARWLDAPMRAVRDAAPSDQRHPLVLLAQGNGQTVPDQAPLAEYLASHGYVVATTPSPMRVTGPLTDEAEMGRRAAEQAVDLEKAADLLIRQRRDIAGDQFGVIGHSFGARAGLLMMMDGARVAALVSLDGGIGTATGRTSMESVAGFHAGAVRSPILHFYERLDDYMTPDFSLLRSLNRSERWIRLVPLRHHLFTSLGAATVEYPRLRGAMAANDTSAMAYSAVERGTLQFLDAFLKRNPAARARVDGNAALPPLGPLERL